MVGLLRALPRSLRAFLAVSLALALSGCAAEPGGVAGDWDGRLSVIHNDRERELPVILRLDQTGHALKGELQAAEGVDERGALPGRRFEILEGLEADGQVYFHARARMATGTVSLVFRGAVENRDGEPHLGGEVAVDVSTTEGELQMTGRLDAERRERDRQQAAREEMDR